MYLNLTKVRKQIIIKIPQKYDLKKRRKVEFYNIVICENSFVLKSYHHENKIT